MYQLMGFRDLSDELQSHEDVAPLLNLKQPHQAGGGGPEAFGEGVVAGGGVGGGDIAADHVGAVIGCRVGGGGEKQ